MASFFGGKRAFMLIMLLLQTTLDVAICETTTRLPETKSSEMTTRLREDQHNSSREHREAEASKRREATSNSSREHREAEARKHREATANSSREHREAEACKYREALAEACDGLKEHDPCTVPDMEDWEDYHHRGGRDDRDREGDHERERGNREKEGDRRGDKDREGDRERERGDREKEGDRRGDKDREGDHERGDRKKEGNRRGDKDREGGHEHERGDREKEVDRRDHKDREGNHERGDRGKEGDRKHDKDREGDRERGDRDRKGDEHHRGDRHRGDKGGKDYKGDHERSGTCVSKDGSHLFCRVRSALPNGKDRARGNTKFKIGFTIQNIDFAELSANQLLFNKVKEGMKEAVVIRIGAGITTRHLTADVLAGSVIGSILVHVPEHMSPSHATSQLSDSKALAKAIEDNVNTIPGIESVAHGKIEVNEDSIEIGVEGQGSDSYQSATIKKESEWILQKQTFYACIAVLALGFLLCTVAAVLYFKTRARSSNKNVVSTVVFGDPVQSVAAEASIVDGYVGTSPKKEHQISLKEISSDLEKQQISL